MRFLRASHSLASGNAGDINAAVSNYRAIANLASQESDHAIYMVASLMEGMAHLRSTGPESMEHAQRAIAQAWAYQMQPDARLPPLLAMAHILDVCCSLLQGNKDVMATKLNAMRKLMDNPLTKETWSRTSDTIAIPMKRRNNSSQIVSDDTRMIIGIGDDGRDNLMLSFLSQNDAYAITSVSPTHHI